MLEEGTQTRLLRAQCGATLGLTLMKLRFRAVRFGLDFLVAFRGPSKKHGLFSVGRQRQNRYVV